MRIPTFVFLTLLAFAPRPAHAGGGTPDAAPAPAPKQEFVYLEFTGVDERELPLVMDALVRLFLRGR